MSSTLDPAKLKVADLRNELSARGLDVKGTKPVLVKRLKDALEKETDKEIPDTSIADTSTEDLDETPTPRKSLRGSTDEKEETRSTRNAPTAFPPSPEKPKPVVKSPEKVEKPPQEKPAIELKTTPTKVPEQPKPVAKSPAKPATPVKPTEKPKVEVTAEVISPVKPEVEAKSPEKVQAETAKEVETEDKAELEQENGEQAEKMEVQEDSEKTADKEIKSESAENEGDGESKGEKRKRSGDSPERSQKRARSPIKEDEPEINAEAVQLSWFDSDLHLQVDKTSFLSAKPITDGAFGYVWAGARATYGVSTGKVCYEVKITEKIKWEEYQQRSDNRYRTDHRKSRRDDRRSPKRSEKSRGESEKRKENSESTNDEAEKKEEISEKKDEGMEVTPDEKKEETDDKITETADKVEETAKTEEPMETTENGDKIDDEKEEKSNEEKEEKSNEEKEEKSKEEKEAKSKEEEEEKPKEAKEKVEELPPLPTHFIRIGWSVASSSLQLGEDKNSYGYESSGKFVKEKEFTDYGITFDADDVVGAFLDISPTTVTLQFTVNGQIQPSLEIPTADLPEDFVLYPHVLSRNYSFEVNFGEKEEPLFAVPSELAADYQFIGKVEDKVAGLARPENRSDCEVILMCGLPASGKTHWTKEHLEANAEKNYTVLGTSTIFERMTISGESIKSKYRGKWGVLVDRVSKALNKLISLAALRRRNYIIDQTNVFPSAQRRKLRPFEGFKRKAVIVVNGEEEQARRQALQEALEGKEVPDSTLLEMKAAMVLPEVGESLEEITYVGATEEEAKEIIKKYNAAGKAAGYGPEKKFNRDRWGYRRNDYRGGRNFQRQGSGGSGGYNRQPYSQNRWGAPRQGGSGGWKQDSRSRDWRGSGGGGYDRRDRDYYNQGSYGGRSQQSSGSRQGGQRWGGSGGGGGWGNQGGWNQQSFGRNYNQGGGGGGWGSQGGGQQGGWGNKYGSSGSGGSQGQNYGGYNNWNYYGQQQQNWGGQGQQQEQQQQQGQSAGGYATNAQTQGQYAQAYSTQEAWAQYAKQYAQHQQMAQSQAAAAAAAQKR